MVPSAWLFYAMVGEHDVGPLNLVVEVGQGPVQHGGKQVFQDVLRELLRGLAEPLLLLDRLRKNASKLSF